MEKKKKKNNVIPMETTPEGYFKSGRARRLPIYECLINKGWEDNGFACVTVCRKHVNGNLSWSVFLVDTYCLGVKNCFYEFNEPASAYQEQKEVSKGGFDLQVCDYLLAHNIIFGAIEFAEEFGFSPHKDFKVAQGILEEDDDNVEMIDLGFGKEGKPFYISGPNDDPAKQDKVLATLRHTAGEDNFHFIIGNELYDEDDDELSDDVWDDEMDVEAFFSPEELDDILDKKKEPSDVQAFVITQRIYNYYFKDKESSLGISRPRDLDILTLLEDSIEEDEKYAPTDRAEKKVVEQLIKNEDGVSPDQFAERLDYAIEQLPHIFELYEMRLLSNELFRIPLKEDFGHAFFEEFPGSPYSKILKASFLYSKGDVDGALALFNNEYKIQHCFPERKGTFTALEIFHFLALMCKCYTAKGDIASAKIFAQTIIKFGDEDELYTIFGLNNLNIFMMEKAGEIGPEEIEKDNI